ncbi:MAG: hypothetical protein ACXQS8_06255, partial [Candidatus Helarchaeales archaeon]
MDLLNIFGNQNFKSLVKNPLFQKFLGELGRSSGADDKLNKTSCYWTSTRWKIEKYKGKDYVISPAFHETDEIKIRFAMRIEKKKFRIHVYVETEKEKKVLDPITCFKIVTEYIDEEKQRSYKVELTPFEELFVTLSNLD